MKGGFQMKKCLMRRSRSFHLFQASSAGRIQMVIGVLLLAVCASLLTPWASVNAATNIAQKVPFEQVITQIAQEVESLANNNTEAFNNPYPIGQVPNIFPEEEVAILCQRELELLHTYDRAQLTFEQQVAYDKVEWTLSNYVAGQKYIYHEYVATQARTYALFYPLTIFQRMNIANVDDAEKYIKRLDQIEYYIDQVKFQFKIRADKGLLPPVWVMDRLIALTEMYSGRPMQPTSFNGVFINKVKKLQLSEEGKQVLMDKANQTLGDRACRGYAELSNYLKEIKSKVIVNAGIWELPEGDDFYAYLLKQHTSTNLTPEEIYNLGVKAVADFQAEVRPLLDELGYSELSIGKALAELEMNTMDTTQIVPAYQAIIDDARTRLSTIFERVPDPLTIEIMTLLAGRLAAYASGNVFVIDLAFPQPIYTMPTLTYHEALPGHIFQGTFANQFGVTTSVSSPIFRVNAYVEGWGLYAERLAYEQGWLKDTASKVGYLQNQLFRAARLVVDTGIHYKHWTREQALDYFIQTTGMNELRAVAEVERYIAWPGQACSYLIGEYKILELRDKAQKELGSKFDLKEFHTAILSYADLPLEVLEKVVDHYIASKK